MMAPNCRYYGLAWRPLLSHYNVLLCRNPNCLTISLHGGLYLVIITDRYGGHQTALTIALDGGLYLAIIMDRYSWPQTALTIALHGGLYLAIVMDLY
jgi:hypothetical protein